MILYILDCAAGLSNAAVKLVILGQRFGIVRLFFEKYYKYLLCVGLIRDIVDCYIEKAFSAEIGHTSPQVIVKSFWRVAYYVFGYNRVHDKSP